MAVIKKGAQTEIGRKIEELAKKVPKPLSYAIPDPYTDPTGGFGLTPMGFTKQAAVKEVVKHIFQNAPGNEAGQVFRINTLLSDLLKVIAKTPERAIQGIEKFTLEPGLTSSGTYHPKNLHLFPDNFPGSMAGGFAHEAGHGASLPIFEKVAKRLGRFNRNATPAVVSQIAHLGYQPELEGIAEYIGRHIQKQAGVGGEKYFGHGQGQEAVYNLLEGYPSKNPYMNVYRYLQDILARPQKVR